MGAKVKSISIFFASAFVFLVLSLSFQFNGSYYENSDYKKFLTSIINDHDFNIINQGTAEENWFVTQTYFHPTIHSESPTPFLLMGRAIELPLLSIAGSSEAILSYKLGFAFFNFLFLALGVYFLVHSVKLLGVQASYLDAVFFLASTAILYFSIFYANVIDIISFCIISYLCLLLAQAHKEKKSPPFLLAGVCLAFAGLFKPYNFLMVLPFMDLANKETRHKIRKFGLFIAPILLMIICDLGNRYLKFETLSNPLFKAMPYLMSYSMMTAIRTFSIGYFGLNGMFVINLSYWLGILGLLAILWQKRAILKLEKYQWQWPWILAIVAAYIFPPIFLITDYVEDHLSGRNLISLIPLLFLGFCYLISDLTPLWKWILRCSLLGLFLFHLVNYVHIDSINYYLYPGHAVLDFSEALAKVWGQFRLGFTEVFVRRRGLAPVFLTAALLAGICFQVYSQKKPKAFLPGLWILCAASFVIMTAMNFTNSAGKIARLKEQNFFDNKAIATGAEAYALDYLLDVAYAFKVHVHPNPELLQPRIEKYFEKLAQQIQTKDQNILEMIDNRDLRLSYYVRSAPPLPGKPHD